MCSSHFPELDFSPFDDPVVVEHKHCYYCWFTNSFKHPATASFTIVVFILAIGMCKMIFVHSCCRTSDGRYIDVAGIIMGTANEEHSSQYVGGGGGGGEGRGEVRVGEGMGRGTEGGGEEGEEGE